MEGENEGGEMKRFDWLTPLKALLSGFKHFAVTTQLFKTLTRNLIAVTFTLKNLLTDPSLLISLSFILHATFIDSRVDLERFSYMCGDRN